MKHRLKKLMALCLSAAMIVTAIPASIEAQAASEIKIEAESGTVIDGDGVEITETDILESDTAASGGTVVAQFDRGNRSLLLENVTDTAKTSIEIYYTVSSEHYGSLDIYVNDAEEPKTVAFYNTGSWSMSRGTSVSGLIDIPAGADIRLEPNAGINLDYIVLGERTDLATIPDKSSIKRIEAEDGYIINTASGLPDGHTAVTNTNCSGGMYYDYLDNAERGIVFENATDTAKTGILVRYSSSHSGNFQIYINDEEVASELAFTSTGGWSDMKYFRYACGNLDIPAGAKITLVPSVAANVDYIELNDSTSSTILPKTGVSKRLLARKLETEGIVLAQNDNNILPLDMENDKIAVFGRGQLAPTTGGSGSGAANGSYTSTFIDGLNALGVEPYGELLEYYQTKVTSRTSIDHGWNTSTDYPGEWGTSVYSGTSWSQTAGVNTPDVKLDDGEITDDGIVARARENADTAIVFITRTTGAEEMDRIKQPGDWYLDPSEKVLLAQVTDKFEDVIVIMSVNGSIDMTWVEEYDIDAVMISYAAGSQNGYALADLVFGLENPSGKLADTITETYEEHPTADTFGYTSYADMGLSGALNNAEFGDTDPVSTYLEGIYMGYRYFDSFGKDVLYPFGSGLSYSDFEFKDLSVTLDSENKAVDVQATIENVTENTEIAAGKEVMEVYLSAPQGDLEQPYQKLMDFEKTEKLAVGESQTITISIPLEDCASYDETQAAYVLEPGDYYLRVGSSSRKTQIAGAFHVEEEILVEQLENRLEISENAKELFEEQALTNKDATPITYEGEAQEMAAASAAAVTVTAADVKTSTTAPTETTYDFQEIGEDEPVYLWSDVQSGKVTLEKFVSQLTEDELIIMLSGNTTSALTGVNYSDDTAISMDLSTKNGGISGAGVTRSIERLGIPSMVFSDGSAGISYNIDGQRNIGWSRAAAVACVWNKELLRQYAIEIGKEMLLINCDIWLAPSINLHRNPLNGRNNEYYSEDPILSGLVAGIVAEGVAESGVTVCLKHYAGNDQEYYRRGHWNNTTIANGTSKDAINVIGTERALREVILKPFEIAVKTGAVGNVMASFNKINGEFAASSEELLTEILRDEWGYEGFVVTDWGDFDKTADADAEMAAGVDVIMSGRHAMRDFKTEMREGLADGSLTIDQLRHNAYHFLTTVYRSSLTSMSDKHSWRSDLTILSTQLPDVKSNYEYSTVKKNPLIAAGGSGSEYTFTVAEDSEAQLPEGINLAKNGTLSGKVAAGQEGVYAITFAVTDDLGNTATKTLSLTVTGELAFTPETLSPVILNKEYSQQLGVTNAAGEAVDAVYTTSDTLPTGITLSEDGVLSGTCTDIGNGDFSFKISAVSEDGTMTGEQNYTLTVLEREVAVDMTALADVTAGTLYAQQLIAGGGYGSYTWNVDYLPEGFILDGDTIVYGYYRNGSLFKEVVPEELNGIYEISVTVTDEMGMSDQKTLTLRAGNPDEEAFAITMASLPDGKIGELYEDVALTVRNADGAVTFSLDENGGVLPEGMELKANGVLGGTPALTSSGEYPIIVNAVDEAGNAASMAYVLYIAGGLTVTPQEGTILYAREGQSFTQQFKATGGNMTEKKFELHESSDALPAGLTLSSNTSYLSISGTPEAGTAGTYHLVFLMDTAEFEGNPVTSVVPYTLVVEPERENLALNKTATESSYCPTDTPPMTGQNAVDGDASTRWSSWWRNGDVEEAWLAVDLGAVYNINEVFISWEDAYASDYKIQVSDDGVTYADVLVSNTYYNNRQHTLYVHGTGRYIKMQCVDAATQYGCSIYEFEVYGTAAEETGEDDETINVKAQLNKLYQAWKEKDLSGYTAASVQAFNDAMTDAQAVLDDDEATVSEARTAMNTLILAIGGLEIGVQKTHLEQAILSAELVIASAEDSEGTAGIAAAVAAGKALMEQEDAAQADVDAAVNVILDELAKYSGDIEELAPLKSLIEEALKIPQDAYTAESYAELQDAIEAAQKVVENKDIAGISDAYAAIVQAIIALQHVGNKAALDAMILKADSIMAAADDYVTSTLDGLADALAAAKEIQAEETAAQNDIDEMTKTLTQEIAQVRLLGDVNGDGAVTTSDSAAVLRAAAEYTELSDVEAESADVNRDGVATTADAVLILQYSVEMISGF